MAYGLKGLCFHRTFAHPQGLTMAQQVPWTVAALFAFLAAWVLRMLDGERWVRLRDMPT